MTKDQPEQQVPWTPGPWIVNPFRAQVDCGFIGSNGQPLPVCQMLWPTNERSEAETEANAHLIAAAPELAAVVQKVHDLLIGDRFYGDAPDLVLEACIAALARAKGQADGQG